MPKEYLDQLLKEYDRKRRSAQLNSEKRKEELYSSFPRLKEIEEELNFCAIQTAKNILNGTNSSLNQLQEKSTLLKKEKEIILKKENISLDQLKPFYECTICEDTGYITTQEHLTKMCNCFKQKLLDISYHKSNLSNLHKENFQTFHVDYFSDQINTEKYGIDSSPRENILNIKQKSMEFVENFDDLDQKNLLFTGNTGLR